VKGRELLRRVDRSLLAIETAVLGAGILGIAAVSITNVFARNLFGGSLPFAEELNQALMLWITFAGLGLGARRARHIRMAAFYDQLRGPLRKAGWMVIAAGTSALLFFLAWLSVRYVVTTREVGGVTPALRVPLWLLYVVVPAGLVLGALEYGLTFVRNLTSDRLHASVDLEEGDEDLEGAS
jgi:TRAP-type C4-dicarboxylate transport system permease small subunit